MCLGLLAGAGCADYAFAQTVASNINPALLYSQSFLVAPKPQEPDGKAAYNWKLPDSFGEYVKGYDSQFDLIRRAASSRVPCDWGIDFSQGPSTQLPDLAQSKAATQAARFRVMWDLQHGRQSEACDDLLAVFVLGRNVARDGLLISTLVQFANEAIDYSVVTGNFGRFSPESLGRLIKGFDEAPARYTAAHAVPSEKALCTDWVLRKISESRQANPGDDKKAIAAISQLFLNVDQNPSSPTNEASQLWTRILESSGGTSDGVAKLVRDLDPFYQKLTSILALPHGTYETQMEQFKAEVAKSSNPLAESTFSAWSRVRQREFRAQIRQAMVRAAVEYKLRGEAGFKSVNDPCGSGPFAFQRFVFEGQDRGFELKSAYVDIGYPEVLIFTETDGPPFLGDGPHAGEAAK